MQALVPAHAITTIHYIVARYRDFETADAAVDWLIRHLEVVTVSRTELLRARALGWADFEDAVVAAAAEADGSDTFSLSSRRPPRTGKVKSQDLPPARPDAQGGCGQGGCARPPEPS